MPRQIPVKNMDPCIFLGDDRLSASENPQSVHVAVCNSVRVCKVLPCFGQHQRRRGTESQIRFVWPLSFKGLPGISASPQEGNCKSWASAVWIARLCLDCYLFTGSEALQNEARYCRPGDRSPELVETAGLHPDWEESAKHVRLVRLAWRATLQIDQMISMLRCRPKQCLSLVAPGWTQGCIQAGYDAANPAMHSLDM